MTLPILNVILEYPCHARILLVWRVAKMIKAYGMTMFPIPQKRLGSLNNLTIRKRTCLSKDEKGKWLLEWINLILVLCLSDYFTWKLKLKFFQAFPILLIVISFLLSFVRKSEKLILIFKQQPCECIKHLLLQKPLSYIFLHHYNTPIIVIVTNHSHQRGKIMNQYFCVVVVTVSA